MNPLLVFIGCGEPPIFGPTTGEIVFEGGAGLESVRRVVIGIDESALAAVCSAGEAGGSCWIVGKAGGDGLIDGREGVRPARFGGGVLNEGSDAPHKGVGPAVWAVGET